MKRKLEEYMVEKTVSENIVRKFIPRSILETAKLPSCSSWLTSDQTQKINESKKTSEVIDQVRH